MIDTILSSFSITSMLLVVLLAVVLIILYKMIINYIYDNKIPRVTGGIPFFGQVFDMIKGSPWDTMTTWVMKFGTIYRIHLFGSDAIVVSDPTLLKTVLQTHYDIFKKDLEWTYKPFMVILGNGLVTADGKSWFTQRANLSSHLRIEILEEIPKMAIKAVERLCIKLDKAKKEGIPIEMAEEFRHLTLQVIAEAILSLSPEESDQTFAHMYLPIVEEGNRLTWNPEIMFLPTPSFFKFRKDVKKLDDYVTSLIVKRWKLRAEEAKSGNTSRKTDVLDKTLDKIPKEDWNASAIKQIRDEVKTFILAGHETSASMLTWSLYELMCNKRCLDEVLKEAKEVFKGKFDVASLPPRSELDKLSYTDCCLKESLRKYSVVPTVVRVASKATKIGEYNIAKGSTLMVNMQGVHHNPEFWPAPMEYKPERFFEEIKPYTFLPFVDGPRSCLGQYLSLLESKVVLSILVSKYKFKVVDKELAGIKHPSMIPIIPKNGHFMIIE